MNISKKTRLFTEDDTTQDVVEIFRSEPGLVTNPGTMCSTETADVSCYLYSTTLPIISSGDIIYNTNNQTSPFDGGNQYYKITNGVNTYIVFVNDLGVLNVEDVCL